MTDAASMVMFGLPVLEIHLWAVLGRARCNPNSALTASMLTGARRKRKANSRGDMFSHCGSITMPQEVPRMPLRDHFRTPLDDETQGEGFHGGWPMMIVASLAGKLPPRYVAAPRVHLGASIEIDVATFEKDDATVPAPDDNGSVATAMWAPPQPTMAVMTDLPALDEYEVRVYDVRRGRRLVAAIEIVSPANKDRPEHRNAFVAKCIALLEFMWPSLIWSRHAISIFTASSWKPSSKAIRALGRSRRAFMPPLAMHARPVKAGSWKVG
jgi:hypothetical protein